ncbi:MAG: hypothetical protein HZA08_04320 [Nitrospirae bacterium]|nr:hypothetical protein [Nitrospirota bacterium]
MNYIRTLSITLVVASFLLAGCGENMFKNQAKTDSETAQKEDAKIALDTGDYTQAITILEKMCGGISTAVSDLSCDKDSKVDLASAYIAEATGLDVLKLIAAAEGTLAKPKVLYSPAAEDDFKKISELIDISKISDCINELTTSNTCEMKQQLTRAIDILDFLLITNPTPAQIASLSSEDKNLYLQLGIASAVDLVISVGVVSGGFCPTDYLPTTIPTSDSHNMVADINRDLGTIEKGLGTSGILPDNLDISNVINKIKKSLDTNSNGSIDFTELKAYITGLIVSSPHC